jgi:hypothetical protein
MQKNQDSLAERFNNFFNTRMLVGIICGLSGIIMMRMFGF